MSLKPDDIEVGMFITVLIGPSEDRGCYSLSRVMDFDGVVLEVLAVDLPYMIVQVAESKDSHGHRAKFDVRDWEFKECSKQYVDAWRRR